MKLPLIVSSDGNGGLFAYLDNTSIVTYGENMDEILANILDAIDKANDCLQDKSNANPAFIEIGEIKYDVFEDDEYEDDEDSVPDDGMTD